MCNLRLQRCLQRCPSSTVSSPLLPSSAGLPPTPRNSLPKEEAGALFTQGSSQGLKVLVLNPKASLLVPPTQLVSGLGVTQAKATTLPPDTRFELSGLTLSFRTNTQVPPVLPTKKLS